MFRLEGLAVAVPAVPARATVSLVLATGAVAAVSAPPSAATALARTVAGLVRPLSGRILVGDRDVTGLPPARRQIGYVPAGGGLLPHLTVLENIDYRLRRDVTVADLVTRRLRSVVDRLDLEHLLDRRPDALTGAQRLRVGIARAMLGLPEVLLIDLPEPGGLGPVAAELLSRLQWRQGAATLSTVVATDDPAVLAMASTVVTARLAAVPQQTAPGRTAPTPQSADAPATTEPAAPADTDPDATPVGPAPEAGGAAPAPGAADPTLAPVGGTVA